MDDPEEVSFEEEDDFDENVYVEEPESEYGTSESNVMLGILSKALLFLID